jgi:hypothetical protein
MELPSELTTKLHRMVRAGPAGLALGDDLGAGSAALFSLYGWATLTTGEAAPQRAFATERGRTALRQAEMESFF